MKLIVKFTGLCLFVPVPKRKVLHVLLPGTGRHVDEHIATLTCGKETFGLTDRLLDLSGASTAGTTTRLTRGAFNIREIVGRRVDAQQLGPEPTDAVLARITLPLGEKPIVGDTARYRYAFRRKKDGVEVSRKPRLSNEFTWIVPEFAVDASRWRLTPLRGSVPPDDLPNIGKDDIFLEVSHLPRTEITIPVGGKAHHVHAYYDLYLRGETGPLPILDEKPRVLIPGGSPFNCMGGVGGP